MQTVGYAAFEPGAELQPWEFTRRAVGDNDVLVEILYCGICHSDIHQVRNEWGNSTYPMVPGHEIVGKVLKVGSKVAKVKVGELCGVGCVVDSCKECGSCRNYEEQFCEKGPAFTFNGTEMDKKTPTYGGYSRHIVSNEEFVFLVSNKLTNLPAVAPLLCAGITVYSPLSHWKSSVGPGKKVAINGLGGLGHMAIKFAVSFGAEVTVFSTSPNKEKDAKRLGAHHFIISKDSEAMKNASSSFDFILDTVSADHALDPLISSLKPHGVLVLVGAPNNPMSFKIMTLLSGNKIVAGSLIGGTKQTQEMLDYCAEHGIMADIELINIDQVSEAYERTVKADVKYRFVIDVSSIKM